MGLQIEDLLGKVKRPVRSTRVCLDGELWARHDELSQQIDAARASSGKFMGDAAGVAELSRELLSVELAMQAAEVEFQFRGVSAYTRDEIIAKYPSKDPRMSWDTTAGAHALLAAASADPVMDEDQARRLVESLDSAATSKLFNCAWTATEGSADVPFFGRASASTSGIGSK